MNLKHLKDNEVYSFKLNSGEELVAKITANHEDFIELSHPVSVAPGPNGVGLMNSMFTANPKEKMRLNIDSVALVAETDADIKKQYMNATSKIVVPDTKKLILG